MGLFGSCLRGSTALVFVFRGLFVCPRGVYPGVATPVVDCSQGSRVFVFMFRGAAHSRSSSAFTLRGARDSVNMDQ